MRSIALLALVAIVLGSVTVAQVPTLSLAVAANSATNGVTSPIFVCSPPGDLNRLFVVQKTGQIKVRTPATAAGVWGTFLNIGTTGSNLITGGSEQGLLGLAFHPNYATNGYFFVFYTSLTGNDTVARYQVSANPDVANAASGLIFVATPTLFSNHNAGMIAFGPDGYLYFGHGDGGSGNDPNGNAQNINAMLGKMHRINVDVPAAPNNYSSPTSNPYYGATPGIDSIWAIGLRNPWRFSFDRLTGNMYIGDVGQSAQEEIDFQPASSAGGLNYGWRCREGTSCTGLSGCTCPSAGLTEPIFTVATGAALAIVGGYVYRGCAIPQLRGWYFYAYYGTGQIFRLQYNGSTITGGPTAVSTISSTVSFGEDANGELYVCSLSGNTVYKIVPAVPQMVGVVSLGAGTPGCNGASALSLGCSPTIHNPGETIISTNGSPSTTGIAILGNAALPPGSDPLGIGLIVLVNLTPATYSLLEFPVSPTGTTILPAAIPNAPLLIGSVVFVQEFFGWSTCSPSPLNLSSTQGLQVTIQP